MRPSTFSIDTLRQFLRRSTTATLPELKRALGTGVDLTVFRKLKQLNYLTSYSHRGRYYALHESAHFDADGLWSHDQVWFSRHGTLLATAEAFVNASPKGFFAEELAQALHVETQDVLRQLTQRKRIARQLADGLYHYTSTDPTTRRQQRLLQRSIQAVPTITDATKLEVSPDEVKASIVLFFSLLDERQRRLYAGLESLKLGRGGDTILADFLGLDPHTVARGRQQLLEQDVEIGRVRKPGGGRKRVEKKRPL
jgi:hypothetical protein